MKISLATKSMKFFNENGVTKIGRKELVVINSDTGEELDEKVGLVWGDKSLIVGSKDSLLTQEHIDGDPEDASYLVLVIRCDSAIEI